MSGHKYATYRLLTEREAVVIAQRVGFGEYPHVNRVLPPDRHGSLSNWTLHDGTAFFLSVIRTFDGFA